MRSLVLLCALCSCAVGFGAQAGLTLDTKGRVSIGVHATTRTGFWSDDAPTTQRVTYWFPQATVGAAWELSTGSLRVDGGITSLGWTRYTKDAWEPSFQLVAPMASARLDRHGFSDLRGCAGIAGAYAKSVAFSNRGDASAFRRIDQTVGVAGEVDLCVSKRDGLLGSIFGGGAYELALFE